MYIPMASKSLLLAALLLVAAVGLAPHGAEAAGKPPLGFVYGVVPCSVESSINVAEVPAFPDAIVQLMCGGRMMAGAKTDGSGTFIINTGGVTPSLLIALLSNQCKVVVATPLAACNASLGSLTGTLQASLQVLGADSGSGSGGLGGLIGLVTQIIGGLLGNVINIIPAVPFSLV